MADNEIPVTYKVVHIMGDLSSLTIEERRILTDIIDKLLAKNVKLAIDYSELEVP